MESTEERLSLSSQGGCSIIGGPTKSHRAPNNADAHKGIHIGPPHRSLGIPRNFQKLPGFFKYFRDCWSNIKVFNQNNMTFELL